MRETNAKPAARTSRRRFPSLKAPCAFEAVAHPNLVFDDQHRIIGAARSGLGVALVDRALIHQDVGRERSAIVSENHIEPRACYRLACAETSIAAQSHVDLFRKWLVREIAAIHRVVGL
ncbi:hypothetical protein [Actibacterium sp. MT2.3-13A]|uniref:hypothetical protein n=1 Tax=Actibacterium sp. MT2.3-13A TaxID=2828332 RepID=UPI001BA93760|nr:hypothetical protein [Actibacterium sp. MT2.3-13A]